LYEIGSQQILLRPFCQVQYGSSYNNCCAAFLGLICITSFVCQVSIGLIIVDEGLSKNKEYARVGMMRSDDTLRFLCTGSNHVLL